MSTRAALLEEQGRHVQAAEAIKSRADAEGRDFTDEERSSLKSAIEAARDAKRRVAILDGDEEMLRGLEGLAPITGGKPGDLIEGAKGRTPGAGKSLGEAFVDADDFVAWRKGLEVNGRIPDGMKGFTSPAIPFAGLKALGAKAIVDSGGLGDDRLFGPQRIGLVDNSDLFRRVLTLRDLVTPGQTGTDTIEYVRWTGGGTNNAAPVPEATGTAGGVTGGDVAGTKPQSVFPGLEKVTEAVRTIAHWLPATKRALSDAGQLRTLIDNFLRYGLDEELEDQMLNGDGTGENFLGILNVGGTQAQAWDTDLLTTLRRAKTRVRRFARMNASAYLLNPEDNERIDLLKNANDDFYFGGPVVQGGNTPVWGLPRIESEAVPVGTAILADWRQAVLYDREQAAIQASDSHADFFVRNLVAILAELRAGFGIFRPSAFCLIDLAP